MATKLTGTWRVVYSELGGQMTPVAHFSGIESTYKGGKFVVKVDGVVEHEGKYSIRERKERPAEITLVYTKSTSYDLNKPRHGIVQVAGDTFKFCAGRVGGAAPAAFNTERRSDAVLTIHQRSGAEGGTGIPVAVNRLSSQW
jgi:uncharacterized protein (TIGR03067 family)